MSNLTFASISEGQELATFQRTTDFMHWNRYAAVNDEFVQLHMDDDAGKKVGQKGAFGMGNLQVAYLHNLLRQWLGDDCWVKKFRCELRGMNFKNDTLTAKGKVLKKYEQGGEKLADVELWTENQNGQKLCPGSATVVIYS